MDAGLELPGHVHELSRALVSGVRGTANNLDLRQRWSAVYDPDAWLNSLQRLLDGFEVSFRSAR